MALYNFTLTLSGVTYETEGLEDALYESGCDDALICAYGNSVYVEFDREAESLDAAIASAVDNIESAGIGAIVESVDSALVGLSDIADITEMSRQAIAMLKDGKRGSGDFPCPIQRIKGQSPLWDWADVAEWLLQNGRLKEGNELVNNARVLSKWNLALRSSASKDFREIEAIASSLIEKRRRAVA
ncbi:DNA-binding protein [Citrobacter amalonaticus]|uniref:DNA-binding protein n=1 Tax=Citrobacter amalonaticus TaxID=35703 RepID=A0ABY0HUX2_CITAM|nr:MULTISPECIES: DNA-binding protein [Citrobacter]MZK91471.1 DNA-binding protein [Citrobacter amalonaticus]MZK96026.1 DNA-binding protein [Citrobacter amalonaticus]MZL05705.1 DNA-binding protein [Citrobacter amalonaticus]MZL16044.1 DNA-binding protein [Citrobacter amalonaticus]MZL25796.1 DNA-binding protein [Citrobacter amalonaticus]